MKHLYPLLALLLVATSGLFAQQAGVPQQPVSAMESEVVFLGKTPPLRDLVPIPSTSPEKKAAVKLKRPPRNFIGRGMPTTTVEGAQPGAQGFDAVRQSSLPTRSVDGDITFLTNIEGLRSGGAPHDPSGDIGKDFYIQAVNATRFQIFNKDGSEASAPISANTLWQSIGRTSAGDPIILYDQMAERWMITEFPNGNELLLAVSDSSDPFGSWNAYSFGTPSFPDYPKWSVWEEAYVVTTNETGTASQTVYFIDRAEILAGAATATLQRISVPGIGNGPGFYVATPVDWTGFAPPKPNAKPMVMRQNDDAWGNVPKDEVDIIEFDIDFDDADNTTLTVTHLATAAYDAEPCSENGPGFGCIPQLDDNAIDGIPAVIMNQIHYQNFGTHESIILNFITDATAGNNIAGIRWMEIRRSEDTDPWTIYQEGTFAPDDGVDRFMGAIAMDGQGNIALAYTTSSANEFPSLKVVGRFANDPLGEMTQQETTIIEGTGSIRGGNRYGDYAQLSVDPFNGRTFWFTSEYGDTDGVTTRIAGFDLKKDTNDLSGRTLINPERISADNTSETPITISIKNVGIDTQFSFKVGYSFEGGEAVIEDVPNLVLAPDSSYVHTFVTTVDMEALGTYSIKAWSDLDNDDFRSNDTIRASPRQLAKFDVAAVAINVPASVCGPAAGIIVTLENRSGRPLTEAVITLSLNGEVAKVTNWTGNLDNGQRSTKLIILTGLEDGDYVVEAVATLPNGETDEFPADNSVSGNMTVLNDGDVFDFALQLDNFPEETSWELADEDGMVLFSGNNFSNNFELIEQEFCLDPDKCYTLTVFDSFGDGIFGAGGFTITNSAGEVVATEDGQFATSQRGEFCASGVCLLEVEADAAPASGAEAADGTVMLTLNNTNGGDFTISFDGGPASTTTIYTNLLPGTYPVTISNGDGCEVMLEVEVGFCSLVATATAVDSSILVIVDAGVEPFSYALDGGEFQNSAEFLDLINGTYTVTVRDALGCDLELEVIVDDPNDVYVAQGGQRVTIFPNPTDGVFKIEMTGMPNKGTLLPIEIFDATGRLVQYNNMVRYDASYFGHFSLIHAPAGTYFLRIVDADITRLLRIVKR
jgi:hypothetical protein